MTSMAAQLVAAGLRISQRLNPHAPYADSEAAVKRRAERFIENTDRKYVHVSREIVLDRDNKPDYQHHEIKDPKDGLVKRVYPKAKTYNAGRNAAKRAAQARVSR